MTSTDDAPDDAPTDGAAAESDDDAFALPRLRRSTYTPPPQYRELLVEPQPEPDAPDDSTETAHPETGSSQLIFSDTSDEAAETPTVETPAGSDEPVFVAPPAPADATEPATALPEPAFFALPLDEDEPQSPEPDHVVYSLDDEEPPAQPAPPVWNPADWAPPAAPAPENIFAMPAAAAPIPEWDTADEAVRDEPVAEPLTAAPVWSLDSDLPEALPNEPHDPYRPWTPEASATAPPTTAPAATEPPAASTPSYAQSASWEALFPTSPPPATPWTASPAAETPVFEAPAAETPASEAPVFEAPSYTTADTIDDTAQSDNAASDDSEPSYLTPDEEAATLAMHAPPAGQPWIPQRRSLPDDQLLSVLEAADSQPGGTLGAMEALENEMRLREEEVQEYREWEDSMLAVGTPEALAVVAQVRPEFSAIVIPVELEPTPTSAIPIQPPAVEPADDSTPDLPAVPEGPTPSEVPVEPTAPEFPAFPGSPEGPGLPETPEVPAFPETPAPETPAPETPQPETPSAPETPGEPAAPGSPETPDAPTAPDAPAPIPELPEPPLSSDPELPTQPHNVVDDVYAWAQPVAAPPELVEPAPEAGADHDMPQSWFDALVAPPTDPTDAPAGDDETTVADVERPAPDASADLPAPGFDDLLADQPDDEPTPEEPKRPFGVAVGNDGGPGSTAQRAPLFSLEQSGEAPTPLELRTGRAARLFWLWFAANSSVVSIGFGAMVFTLGMSLRQSIVATLAGVALSFLPLGLGTLAGKLSGQPTVVVSRAVFGLSGNVLPAVLALVSRVFWGSVLLWLFATSIATVLGGDGPVAGLVIIFIVIGVMVAVVVAFLGFALLARFQLIVSILSAVLIVGFVALTWNRVDIQVALTVADGPWILVATGAVLVFSFVGLVWANSSSDLARYQRPSTRGSSNMLWATFGTTLPAFVLIGYGALLAASDPGLAAGLVGQPVDALTGILPAWYPVPLVVATGLSLLSGVIITIYSGAFAVQGIGIRVERQWATLAIGTLLAVVAVGLSVLDVDLSGVFRDLSTTLAVPIAAWLGIFSADAMIRNRRLHADSLLRPGGIYPAVNWVNLSALVGITIVGWGLTTALLTGLQWQGYGYLLLGVPLGSDLAGSDLGVLVALVLGLIVPLVSGVPTIRRQEAAARLI